MDADDGSGEKHFVLYHVLSAEPRRHHRQMIEAMRVVRNGGVVVREEVLPAGWMVCEDDEGNTYYLHEATGESSWDKPAAAEAVAAANDDAAVVEMVLPEGWTACADDDGNTYYVNGSTGESMWDMPQ